MDRPARYSTVVVPFIVVGCRVHWYVMLAGAGGIVALLTPVVKPAMSASPDPAPKVTLWVVPSELVQLTVPPFATRMDDGLNWLFLISTAAVVGAGVPPPPPVLIPVLSEPPPQAPETIAAKERMNSLERMVLLEMGFSVNGSLAHHHRRRRAQQADYSRV